MDRAYHSFLVGSDQVWGLSGESFPEVFFLPFTEKWKRNSFAASFGFSTIPQKKMIHRYKEALLAMNKISVREYEGADIVKSLTNRLPFVHLDPTFLLNRNDWDDIALQSTIHSHSKDYILTYFLGCKSQVWSDGINELALKDHLEIINLNDVNQQNFFSISLADFVNLFRSAKYVVTDSFHGAALSIIFKRRFIIADREDRMLNMNSRILTLLDRMDLTERFMVDVTVENILNTFANKINFKIANEVIKSNLVESNQYLSKLL